MRSKSFSFALLSAVTSAERAEAIEGDLLEERKIHGTSWFVLHVIRTTFALFGLALTEAPYRTAALSVASVLTACLVCPLVDRAFLAPEAVIPSPLVGFAAIVGIAVLIGAGLAHVAGALGVRAAAATSVLLVLMFILSQASGDYGQLQIGEASGIRPLDALGSFAVKLALALCMFPGPLLVASAWTHARRL